MFASYTWEPWKSSGCLCKVPRSSVDEKREFSQLSCPAPVKREQELHESWWELRSKSLHQSFFSPVKRCVRWELTGYYRAGGENTHQFSSEFKPAQSWWNLIGGRARDTTLISQSQSHVYEGVSFRGTASTQYRYMHICADQNTIHAEWNLKKNSRTHRVRQSSKLNFS